MVFSLILNTDLVPYSFSQSFPDDPATDRQLGAGLHRISDPALNIAPTGTDMDIQVVDECINPPVCQLSLECWQETATIPKSTLGGQNTAACKRKKAHQDSDKSQVGTEGCKRKSGICLEETMRTAAAAMGSIQCVYDWSRILRDWRARHALWAQNFGDTTSIPSDVPVQEKEICSAQIFDTHSGQWQRSAVGHDIRQPGMSEKLNFKTLFLEIQGVKEKGTVPDMRYRWIMAAINAEYLALMASTKRSGMLLRNGRQCPATMAQEQLFAAVYDVDYTGRVTSTTAPSLWRRFRARLYRADRWGHLSRRFGMGVLALLPQDVVTTSFVENTMDKVSFKRWVDMVHLCCPDLHGLAALVQPIFLACVEARAPPPVRLRLEMGNKHKLLEASDIARMFESERPDDQVASGYDSSVKRSSGVSMCGVGDAHLAMQLSTGKECPQEGLVASSAIPRAR